MAHLPYSFSGAKTGTGDLGSHLEGITTTAGNLQFELCKTTSQQGPGLGSKCAQGFRHLLEKMLCPEVYWDLTLGTDSFCISGCKMKMSLHLSKRKRSKPQVWTVLVLQRLVVTHHT